MNCWGPFHLIDTPPLPMKKVTIYTQRKKRSKANWYLTPSEISQYKVLNLLQKKKKFISQPFRIYDKDKRCPIATLPPPKTYFLSFTASENPINNWSRGTGCLNTIPLRANKGRWGPQGSQLNMKKNYHYSLISTPESNICWLLLLTAYLWS